MEGLPHQMPSSSWPLGRNRVLPLAAVLPPPLIMTSAPHAQCSSTPTACQWCTLGLATSVWSMGRSKFNLEEVTCGSVAGPAGQLSGGESAPLDRFSHVGPGRGTQGARRPGAPTISRRGPTDDGSGRRRPGARRPSPPHAGMCGRDPTSGFAPRNAISAERRHLTTVPPPAAARPPHTYAPPCPGSEFVAGGIF
jgi:hypothetical protein